MPSTKIRSPKKPARGQVSQEAIVDACLRAVALAEKRHAKWSGGVTMRAAPESLVQTVVAEVIARAKVKLLLEVSVVDMKNLQAGVAPTEEDSAARKGRVDLVAYNKKSDPRFIVEIKKLSGNGACLLEDCRRIHDLMATCKSIQSGIMLGYTSAAKEKTITDRIASVEKCTGSKLLKVLPLRNVVSKKGAARMLGAAIFCVRRSQTRP